MFLYVGFGDGFKKLYKLVISKNDPGGGSLQGVASLLLIVDYKHCVEIERIEIYMDYHLGLVSHPRKM
jgi:hypothetical protein